MSEEVRDWLVEWFVARSVLDEQRIRSMVDDNYFDADLVDSFGVIELIGEMEEQFSIEFADRDFQDRRFSTITGLAEMIGELQGGAT